MKVSAVVGIAVGSAAVSFLLTVAAFLLWYYRSVALLRAIVRKERTRAPVIREEHTDDFGRPRHWLSCFDERNLDLDVVVTGAVDESGKISSECIFEGDGQNIWGSCGIKYGDAPNFDPAKPWSIKAALALYFDNEVDLGINPKVVENMLLHGTRQHRQYATDFLIHKVIFSLSVLRSSPKHSLLPAIIQQLAKDLWDRGPKLFETGTYSGEDVFHIVYQRWRIGTFRMYGRDRSTMPDVEAAKTNMINFFVAVLDPFIKPGTEENLQLRLSLKLDRGIAAALFRAGQIRYAVPSWDWLTPTEATAAYIGQPKDIPPFNMMAEKTLVVAPSIILVDDSYSGRPLYVPYTVLNAVVVKFTDGDWAKYTESLEE